ncbi:hypothetical protein [Stutzerimonas tarimensis]|uniref:Phosphoribosyl-AMP cyclohydrolase n=1 Tax=Stutzerimonas tarimensis TaxID=1507735 RepID=A0ABV7T9R8_9GAMM
MIKRNLALPAFIATALALGAGAVSAEVVNNNITEAEVKAAQEAWGQALIQISDRYAADGIDKAREKAEQVLDAAYGYGQGAVLFKPTLASGEQTFRIAREGALAYFVGHDESYPDDSGFALKGWKSYSFENAAVYINGDLALTTGHVRLTDADGQETIVDKSWAFKKDEQGALRIVLHHSSLPYAPGY